MSATWRDNAICQHVDPEEFFPPSYKGIFLRQVEEARATCRACPVIADCLADALATERGRATYTRHGIRAALTPAERHALSKPTRQVTA